MLHFAETTPGGLGGWPPNGATAKPAQDLVKATADA